MNGHLLAYCSQINGLDVLLWLLAGAVYHIGSRLSAADQARGEREVDDTKEALPGPPAPVRRPKAPSRLGVVGRREASLRREARAVRGTVPLYARPSVDVLDTPGPAPVAIRREAPRLAA